MCKPETIEYLSIASIYAAKISGMVTQFKEDLCPCRYEILTTKWSYWINWYLNNALKSSYRSIDELLISATATNQHYEADLRKTKHLSQPLIELFLKIHSIAVEEFEEVIKTQITDKAIENVYLLGELLLILCKQSITELISITIPCSYMHRSDCPHCIYHTIHCGYCNQHHLYANGKDRNVTIFFTEMFSINNYGIKKVKLLHEQTGNYTHNIGLVFDFSLYEGKPTSKIHDVVKQAKSLFPRVLFVNCPDWVSDSLNLTKEDCYELNHIKD